VKEPLSTIPVRETNLPGFVTKNDLAHLTDPEIEALHAYLVARARRLGS
jgi:hypothetical protein